MKTLKKRYSCEGFDTLTFSGEIESIDESKIDDELFLSSAVDALTRSIHPHVVYSYLSICLVLLKKTRRYMASFIPYRYQ